VDDLDSCRRPGEPRASPLDRDRIPVDSERRARLPLREGARGGRLIPRVRSVEADPGRAGSMCSSPLDHDGGVGPRVGRGGALRRSPHHLLSRRSIPSYERLLESDRRSGIDPRRRSDERARTGSRSVRARTSRPWSRLRQTCTIIAWRVSRGKKILAARPTRGGRVGIITSESRESARALLDRGQSRSRDRRRAGRSSVLRVGLRRRKKELIPSMASSVHLSRERAMTTGGAGLGGDAATSHADP